jgi:hypothetical protein
MSEVNMLEFVKVAAVLLLTTAVTSALLAKLFVHLGTSRSKNPS